MFHAHQWTVRTRTATHSRRCTAATSVESYPPSCATCTKEVDFPTGFGDQTGETVPDFHMDLLKQPIVLFVCFRPKSWTLLCFQGWWHKFIINGSSTPMSLTTRKSRIGTLRFTNSQAKHSMYGIVACHPMQRLWHFHLSSLGLWK